ncbi:MAG: hypothetical protein DMF98_04305 [Acidobacteria bacterium]|nr:MAG: hypothetical protein DMF98_04305 [Acidobacteriota bacterium]
MAARHRCRAADDGIRGREAGGAGADCRRQRAVDTGRLVALRSQTCTGRADCRRRRCGSGVAGRRSDSRAAPRASRRNPSKHPRRGSGAGRAERPLRYRKTIRIAPRDVERGRRWGSARRAGAVSRSTRVRVGAVGYLNARPLVYGLERSARFDVRYDVPSECARLLHDDAIDIGLIPSIEYLRGGPYAIVPDLAIASRGPVASVLLYVTRPIDHVRSIAMDTSSRTSVALARVLCARLFKIQPVIDARGPDLPDMLSRCDAALIIGDNALFLDPRSVRLQAHISVDAGRWNDAAAFALPADAGAETPIQAIDLGDAWTRMTGLPFVYAFWAGRPGVLTAQDVAALTGVAVF